jgi:hypothetical protein
MPRSSTRSITGGSARRLTALALLLLVAALPAVPAHAAADGAHADTTADVTDVRLEPMPAGNGVVHASATVSIDGATPPTLGDDYEEVEYLLSGIATTYSGPAQGPAVEASSGNPYVTRVIARFPTKKKDFSGRVFLEPFNTTSGPDRDVIWRQVAPLFQADGDGWVGVSVRATSASQLQQFDAVRYADVSIPSNDIVWDVLRQLGTVVRAGGARSPLGDLRPQHLYMGGYSQSGVDTATFAQSFHDSTRLRNGSPVYDGYFPAAHAATMTPLQTGSALVTEFEEGSLRPVDVPVVDIETQHDSMGWSREVVPGAFYTSQSGASVRRPESNTRSDKYRLFEIAGASHSSGGSANCGGTPSSFPGPMFVRGAMAKLFRWAEHAKAPASAPRIDMEKVDVVSVPRVDDAGNATGGVRSPFVDVPLVHYRVQAGGTGLQCTFSGIEQPLAAEVLASRYGDVDGYMTEFGKRLDATIKRGDLLKSDRAAILESARTKAATLLPAGG